VKKILVPFAAAPLKRAQALGSPLPKFNYILLSMRYHELENPDFVRGGRVKGVLLAVVLCLGLMPAAFTQDDPSAPATREDIEHYLNVVHSQQMMQQMLVAMASPMHKMVHDQYLKNQDKLPADFEQREMGVLDEMFHNMPVNEMIEAMEPVYQKHFTKGDVNALIAFYSSPTGQKMLLELPSIMSEAMESITPLMEKYMETVKQRIQDEFAEALKPDKKDN
jgi:hypothetical protein